MPYVASGTYGCIFKPSLGCSKTKGSSKKGKGAEGEVVGKLFTDSKEAEIEQRIHESIVHKVDPNGVFTIKLIDICEIKEDELTEDDGSDECPLLFDRESGISPAVYKQIIYQYGGVSLDSYLKNELPTWAKFKRLLYALGPVFEGVSKLNKMGWVHQDIKPGNILIHDNGAFLIDFGLMTEVKKIYADANNFVLNYPYPYYPPEFKLKAADGSIDRFRKLVGENFDSMMNVKNRLIEVGVDFGHDLNACFESAIKDPLKIDSYSLGVVLTCMFNWAYEHVIKKKRFMGVFVVLIQALCCQDANKRATSEEAAVIYKQVLETTVMSTVRSSSAAK
jgi:serine/threonine protein kinase